MHFRVKKLALERGEISFQTDKYNWNRETPLREEKLHFGEEKLHWETINYIQSREIIGREQKRLLTSHSSFRYPFKCLTMLSALNCG